MVDDVYQVELTASFLERLEAIDAFMSKANLSIAIDDLLSELRATVIPNLARFPRIGRRYVDNPPQSVEALAQLAILPEGSANALCEYLFGDYLVLYVAVEVSATVYFLSIRYHRQLSFDFARHWPTAV
ncbi:type II toxin-antitoxin system RelE/ParE family toxin [Achromobacter xylosoxidans]